MQLIYKAANVTEAQIVKGLLESRGIQAHVGGYYLQGAVGELSTMDFANVHVADEDYSRARDIVDEYDAGYLASADERATSGSETKAFLIRLLILILIALCAGILSVITH